MSKAWIAGLVMASLLGGPAFAAGSIAAGKEKSYACSACHGTDGKREVAGSPGMPRIAGMDETRIANSLRAYRAGTKFHPFMQIMLWTMSDKDIDDMAAYYASLKD